MRLKRAFFIQDALIVAPGLLGAWLVRKMDDGSTIQEEIIETEVYRGIEDEACHAHKGKTTRTEVMFRRGGFIYVYMVYGMYWLLNIVTGEENFPQAVLIRATGNCKGPGILGRRLQLNKDIYGEDITTSKRLWVEAPEAQHKKRYICLPRVGVDYAGEWSNKPWRYVAID